MIVCGWNCEDEQNNVYYISPSEKLEARLPNGGPYHLVNQRPVELGRLEGDLKVDSNGNHYFNRGIKIRKLLVEEWPFYDVKNSDTTSINGQNAAGWIVGKMNTIYPSQHAFLALPELTNQTP